MKTNEDTKSKKTKCKVSAFMACSLDGFIARENGDISWLETFPTKEVTDFAYGEFFDSTTCMLLGRNTFHTVCGFAEWPYRDKKVFVWTHSPERMEEYLVDFRRKVQVTSLSPRELVEKLSIEGEKNLYVDGGKSIQSFLKEGYLDEITITRIPILLGNGIPLFADFKKEIRLECKKTTTYENGFVQSTYQISKNESEKK